MIENAAFYDLNQFLYVHWGLLIQSKAHNYLLTCCKCQLLVNLWDSTYVGQDARRKPKTNISFYDLRVVFSIFMGGKFNSLDDVCVFDRMRK